MYIIILFIKYNLKKNAKKSIYGRPCFRIRYQSVAARRELRRF